MPSKKILAVILITSLLSPELITAPTIRENHLFAKIKSSYQTFKQDMKDLLNPRKQCNHAQKRNVATKVSGMAAIVVVGVVGVTICGTWYKRMFTEARPADPEEPTKEDETYEEGAATGPGEIVLEDETDQAYVIRYIEAKKSGKEITPPRDLQESLQKAEQLLGITADDWDNFIQPDDDSPLSDPERQFLLLLQQLNLINGIEDAYQQDLQERRLSSEDALEYFLELHEKLRDTILGLERLAPQIDAQQLMQYEEFSEEDSASESESDEGSFDTD